MPRPPKNKPQPLDLQLIPFSENLSRIRKLRGFTQYSLADLIGVSRKQIADYERAVSLPNSDMIIRLSLALKVSSDTLLGLKELSSFEPAASTRFTKRIKDIEALPESKKQAIVKILDEFIYH
jgi:transcriptional regulator with XRE-family HTH domain